MQTAMFHQILFPFLLDHIAGCYFSYLLWLCEACATGLQPMESRWKWCVPPPGLALQWPRPSEVLCLPSSANKIQGPSASRTHWTEGNWISECLHANPTDVHEVEENPLRLEGLLVPAVSLGLIRYDWAHLSSVMTRHQRRGMWLAQNTISKTSWNASNA